MYLKQLFTIIIITLLAACGSDSKNSQPKFSNSGPSDEEVIKIPVVVHVIYYNDETNVTTEKIESQIAVLNEDFRKLNADYTQTPDEFLSLVADVGIEFELATIDPEGHATEGITRTFSDTVSGFSGDSTGTGAPAETFPLYFTHMGGQDAWPTDQYLNIWVAEMQSRLGRLEVAGYAHPIGSDPRIDGVVIEPRALGLMEPLTVAQSKGRTATHEIGHWLNLHHIYANGTNCESSDEVDDTPNALTQYEKFPVYPQTSCGSTDITMNFMDNVDDRAMYMFTNGQRERMRAVFKEGGGRHQLYLNSLNYFAE